MVAKTRRRQRHRRAGARARILSDARPASSGRDRRAEIRQNLDPQCLSGFRKDDELPHPRLDRGADHRTCPTSCSPTARYEEMLQALEPDQRHRQRSLDHVQRRRPEGLFRRLRPASSSTSSTIRASSAGMTAQRGRGRAAADTARCAGVRGGRQQTRPLKRLKRPKRPVS